MSNTPETPGTPPAAGDGQFAQPQPPYGQPQAPYGAAPTYQQPAYGNAPQAPRKTNLLAILSLIAPFVGFSLIGIVLGFIALSQIKKTGEQGRGLALAGTIISAAAIVLSIIGVILFFVFVGAAGGFESSYSTSL